MRLSVSLVSGHRANWYAGASTVFLHLDEALRHLGHNVRLFHQTDYDGRRNGSSINKLTAPRRVAALLDAQPDRPDVIEVAGNLGWAAFERIGNGRTAPLRVARLHGLEFKDEQARVDEFIAGVLRLPPKYMLFGRRVANVYERRTIAAADVVVCHSSRESDAVVAAGWKREADIELMPLGVDERFQFERSYDDRTGTRLIWWGSWVERKGISTLPRTFELAWRMRPDLTLTIGGTGADPSTVLSAFAPNCRSRVTVLPFVSPEEHVAALRSHDVFLFPSLSEGFGLALLEAMATGLPAVTTFTGMAHDWLEHGVNALLVPLSAPTATANAIVRLAGDQSLRERLGTAARRTAALLSWDRLGRRSAEVYADRLARKRAERKLNDGSMRCGG